MLRLRIGIECMPTKFDKDVRETIERCRRLAGSTTDMQMASRLLAMADDMEKAIKHAPRDKSHHKS